MCSELSHLPRAAQRSPPWEEPRAGCQTCLGEQSPTSDPAPSDSSPSTRGCWMGHDALISLPLARASWHLSAHWQLNLSSHLTVVWEVSSWASPTILSTKHSPTGNSRHLNLILTFFTFRNQIYFRPGSKFPTCHGSSAWALRRAAGGQAGVMLAAARQGCRAVMLSSASHSSSASHEVLRNHQGCLQHHWTPQYTTSFLRQPGADGKGDKEWNSDPCHLPNENHQRGSMSEFQARGRPHAGFTDTNAGLGYWISSAEGAGRKMICM